MLLPGFFQTLTLIGLTVCLGKVILLVRAEAISDKYGTGWVVALIAFLILNGVYDFYKLISPAADFLLFFSSFGFIGLGVFFSVRLTAYSRVRRESVQEVALLRFRFQELEKISRRQTPDPVF